MRQPGKTSSSEASIYHEMRYIRLTLNIFAALDHALSYSCYFLAAVFEDAGPLAISEIAILLEQREKVTDTA